MGWGFFRIKTKLSFKLLQFFVTQKSISSQTKHTQRWSKTNGLQCGQIQIFLLFLTPCISKGHPWQISRETHHKLNRPGFLWVLCSQSWSYSKPEVAIADRLNKLFTVNIDCILVFLFNDILRFRPCLISFSYELASKEEDFTFTGTVTSTATKCIKSIFPSWFLFLPLILKGHSSSSFFRSYPWLLRVNLTVLISFCVCMHMVF